MKLLFILLTLICSTPIIAQNKRDTVQEKENIKLMTRVRNGVVELRWYPANSAAWRKANQLGYTISRKDLNDDTKGTTQLAIIKPYTTEEWKQKTNTNDRLVKGTMDIIKPAPVAKDPVSNMNDESERFVMYILATSLSADAAKGAGLIYNDKVEPGKQYMYSVSINNGKAKKNDRDEVMALVTDTRTPYIAPAVKDVTAEEGEGFVKLSWNNTTNRELFTAYNIERSNDGGRTFGKINKLPFTPMAEQTEELYYTDSIKNYIPYQYRIIGITPWVDESNPSDVVMGMGRDRTPATPPINTVAKGDRSKITVTWQLPKPSKDLKGFKVARAGSIEGPYTSLNEKFVGISDRMFVDNKPSPREPFYAVYAVDTANNMSSSFSVMASIYDSVPPSQPMGLTGHIDSNGVVKLNWIFGSDNDLLGYQVYVANKKTNVYKQLTSSPRVDSAWVDTVNMRSLTEEVYYKITAVDYNNNPSEYSEILTLKRPDIIPPAAPIITGYNIQDNKVMIRWENSNSSDVTKHRLVRKLEGSTKEVKTLLEFRDNTTLAFTDSSVTEGESYSYEVQAFDGVAHVTPSLPLAITIAEASIKPGVERFTAKWNSSGKSAKLQWHFTDKGEYELVLFRAGEDGELKAYKKLSADKRFYEEQLNNGKYKYAIKVIYANGAESILSEPVSIDAI